MAATAKIISLDDVRQSKAQQLTVTLSELVTTNRIPGLVTIKTDPEAIARIKIALSDAEYAMKGRRRENDSEFGRSYSFTTILEPCEVYYSLCPKRHQLDIETVYCWFPPTPPPEDELESVTPNPNFYSREESATLSVRHAARVAAVILFCLCTCLSAFMLGRSSYQQEVAREVLSSLLHPTEESPLGVMWGILLHPSDESTVGVLSRPKLRRTQAAPIEMPTASISRSDTGLNVGGSPYFSSAATIPWDIHAASDSANPRPSSAYINQVSYAFASPRYLGASVFSTKEFDVFGIDANFGASLPNYNLLPVGTYAYWELISADQWSLATSMFSVGVSSEYDYSTSRHLDIDHNDHLVIGYNYYIRDCLDVGNFYSFDFQWTEPVGRIQQNRLLDASADRGACRNGQLAFSLKAAR